MFSRKKNKPKNNPKKANNNNFRAIILIPCLFTVIIQSESNINTMPMWKILNCDTWGLIVLSAKNSFHHSVGHAICNGVLPKKERRCRISKHITNSLQPPGVKQSCRKAIRPEILSPAQAAAARRANYFPSLVAQPKCQCSQIHRQGKAL